MAWSGRVGVRETLSLGRGRRGLCEPGGGPGRVAEKPRAGALGRIRSRRHSSFSALLKGRAHFYPADPKALHPPVFRPGLKGKRMGSRSPPSGPLARVEMVQHAFR